MEQTRRDGLASCRRRGPGALPIEDVIVDAVESSPIFGSMLLLGSSILSAQ